MSKNIYQKEFTRDFSIIMEEAWFYALTSGIKRYFYFTKSNIVPLVFYSHNGTIEVWSDGKIIDSYLNKINQLVKKRPEIFTDILDDYEKQLKSLNIIFKSKHLKTKRELDKFIKSIFKIITPFAVMYYLAEDGLGNGKIVNRARALRHQDSFYEDCDNFLRYSLLFLYPKLKGLEALVTSSEIKMIPKLAILQARYNGFVFIPGNFKKAITLKKFSEQHPDFIFTSPKITFNNKILKGTSASDGKAKGKVRIIFNKSEIKSFKTGEILVAPMTTPDYISAMKKAKAFITDEGGTLCHAAIIARELKKPCVIGTKMATQVLKIGDFVEVDADTGIITILNKVSNPYRDIEIYKKSDWINVSKGNWSFLSCSDFINHYTREVLIEGNNPFDHPLQVCYKGKSELWYPKSEIDYFGKRLVNSFNNLKKIKNLCQNAKREANNVFDFIKNNPAKNFNSHVYREFWDVIKAYYQYHLPIKYIGDYLSESNLKKYKPFLQDARVYAEPVFDETEKLTRKIIENVSGKIKIDKELVACFTREELSDYFDKNIYPSKSELQNRNRKAILWSDKKNYGYFTGENTKKIESFFYNYSSDNIKGVSAFGGIVRGIVRIIDNPLLVKDFKKGSVLVAGMTRPDYFPFVKKSSAVITDAGGILSHAAIIARELKKPCVIGTKIATKVLHNGDLVEVDANKGLVKIINR